MPRGTFNAVAARVEVDFPDVLVDTLAYRYSRKPPRKVRPAHNVIVRLCSIECSSAVPLSDSANAAFARDLGWLAVALQPALLARVERLRVPLLCAFFVRWTDLRAQWGPDRAWPVSEDPRQLLAAG